MTVRELDSLPEMLENLSVLNHMYPDLTPQEYEERLKDMLPYRYRQIAVYDQETCIAISGYWLHTKLWVGRVLELDNFVVIPSHQGKGVGKLLQNYLENIALKEKCQIMALDAFVTNFKAHRFYINQGYVAKGYHFVKFLKEN